jgi:ferritin
MLTEKMQTALNGQLNAELYSSYLYLSMNAYFKSVNLDGFANWMYYQAQEELEHSMKFYDFVIQRGLINDLVEVALEERDHATNIFLQWFVSEQVEEEESVNGVLEQLKLMGDAQGGLFMIDRELAKRSPSGSSEESE